jgi:hypothetical protein
MMMRIMWSFRFLVVTTQVAVANEYKIALYYSTVASGTLTAVQVAFAANTTTESCIVEVFDAINDQSLSDPIITEVYDLLPGDISAGAVPTFRKYLDRWWRRSTTCC